MQGIDDRQGGLERQIDAAGAKNDINFIVYENSVMCIFFWKINAHLMIRHPICSPCMYIRICIYACMRGDGGTLLERETLTRL